MTVDPLNPVTSEERLEDLAFENRVRTLTRARKWDEVAVVFMVWGSAMEDRDPT